MYKDLPMDKIICVTNRLLVKTDFIEKIEEIAKNKPHAIILREKDLSIKDYKELAKKCLDICNKHNVDFIINSHIDIANELNIKNIHLPMSLFIKENYKLNSFNKIGISIHNLDEINIKEKNKPTYFIAGHIYETDCKKNIPARGINFFKDVCKNTNIPVYAIGGIDKDNIKEILNNGGVGGAIMSGLMK